MPKVINEQLIKTLLNALESYSTVFVKFHTKLGKERTMRCSRLFSSIPEQYHEGVDDFRINGDSIIGVFDFQNSAWRSFRKDSVISFEVNREYD